jgi:hypothetical protein
VVQATRGQFEWSRDALLLLTVVQRLQDGADGINGETGLPWREAYLLGLGATVAYLEKMPMGASSQISGIAREITEPVWKAYKRGVGI